MRKQHAQRIIVGIYIGLFASMVSATDFTINNSSAGWKVERSYYYYNSVKVLPLVEMDHG